MYWRNPTDHKIWPTLDFFILFFFINNNKIKIKRERQTCVSGSEYIYVYCIAIINLHATQIFIQYTESFFFKVQ